MTRFRLSLPQPWHLCGTIAAVLAAGGVAALAMTTTPEPDAVMVPAAAPALVQPAIVRDRNCASCGFVRTIRRVDPDTGLASYEFSVRMRDGSSRDSTEATRGAWVEGDRVILIGGSVARALEEKNAAL